MVKWNAMANRNMEIEGRNATSSHKTGSLESAWNSFLPNGEKRDLFLTDEQ